MIVKRRTTGQSFPDSPPKWYVCTLKLIGESATLRSAPFSLIGVHDMVANGLKGGAILHLLQNVKVLHANDVLGAVGVSSRTAQRHKLDPKRPLAQEQSGRTWRFAQVLAKAQEVFENQEEAEKWLATPAIALDQRRPIDLLSSPVGAELVEQLLGRIELGVYT